MTPANLTHDEIAGMTCREVNIAVAARRGELCDGNYPDYCHDWSHAGRLLDMMGEYALSGNGTRNEVTTFTQNGDIDFTATTAPEAIARCWLEWWEVTHD